MNILAGKKDNIIVIGLMDKNIFHEFNQEGELLRSFGEPFEIPSQ